MATLNGETICPGDSVYDIAYGPGQVTAVDAKGNIHVSFGSAGRPRQYSSNGMTGKLCNRTLFHSCPAIIEFSRNECHAHKKKVALTNVMDAFEEVLKIDCSYDDSKHC